MFEHDHHLLGRLEREILYEQADRAVRWCKAMALATLRTTTALRSQARTTRSSVQGQRAALDPSPQQIRDKSNTLH